ncbi:hypothetical protein llap_12626 [Limosa lapponica baueri]|uniref:Uncharacterized protein n=1 Tax=Limosa lapponica baueri TaxID=1758121 RepID=A0A2I0TTF1_LIMLA|nr:hypothetical protein llap_12626 [Limosa lapponica baueri]
MSLSLDEDEALKRDWEDLNEAKFVEKSIIIDQKTHKTSLQAHKAFFVSELDERTQACTALHNNRDGVLLRILAALGNVWTTLAFGSDLVPPKDYKYKTWLRHHVMENGEVKRPAKVDNSTYQINISNWKETGLEQDIRIQIYYDADEPSSGSLLPSRR